MAEYRSLERQDWTGRIILVVFVGAVGALVLFAGSQHPLVTLAGIALMLFLLVAWNAARHAYRCASCGHEFEISVLRSLVTPHMPGSKYLVCPRCKDRTWARVLVKA
jgi:DNA-directed RNA polymerase subunit RPC12/RpoP